MTLLCIETLRTPQIGPISLEVSARELVVVTGASGSGKSLFLRAVADLDPNDGEVRLEGKLRETYPPTAWRRQVALLPAESAWWGDSVGEHFTGLDSRLLASVCLEGDVSAWPVGRLSSGERQRLGLLRVLVNRPKVLLLDEPTANLDGETTRCVEAAVQNYVEESGACVLWVSHISEQIRRLAHRVIHFHNGRIMPDSR